MKLYGFVCENPDGELYVTHWFFSPEDRQKYVEEGSARMVEVFGEDEAWVYEKHYWFTEVNTEDIPYIHCGIGVNKLEEEREAKLLAEEEKKVSKDEDCEFENEYEVMCFNDDDILIHEYSIEADHTLGAATAAEDFFRSDYPAEILKTIRVIIGDDFEDYNI